MIYYYVVDIIGQRHPSAAAVSLFGSLADALPKVKDGDRKPGDMNAAPGGGSGAPVASAAMLPGGPPPEVWRNIITALYAHHNPSKLSDVEALLSKYRGKERTLYIGICEKYKIPPNPDLAREPGMPPPMGFPATPWGAPAAAPAVDEEKVKKMRELICEVYKEHNPDKLKDVDKLLQKYQGREEVVYHEICKKYKAISWGATCLTLLV